MILRQLLSSRALQNTFLSGLLGLLASLFGLNPGICDDGVIVSTEGQATGVAEVSAALTAEPPSDDAVEKQVTLTDVLKTAKAALQQFDQQVSDYTCLLIKRERIDQVLHDHQYIWMKVRERQKVDQELVTPLSIYARFLKPPSLAGREVLFVENQRNGFFLTRRGGPRFPNMTLLINPTSPLARRESRYPIHQAGLRSMLRELVTRLQAEEQEGTALLRLSHDATFEGKACTRFEVMQTERRADSDYMIARVLMEDESQIPVYFASYDWPASPEGRPVLQEEYMFTRMSLNPGLTDKDFQRDNEEYKFSAKVETREEAETATGPK